ncbi:hypothetical protein PICST_51170, partial [Scheffersomyces stipitis CBS 6054]
IKPVNEYRAPRHQLDDDEESVESKPSPIPTVAVVIDDSVAVDYVLISPSTIGIISANFPRTRAVGKVSITYPELYAAATENSEAEPSKTEDASKDYYDEDEQLYSAIEHKVIQSKYAQTEIPLYYSETNKSLSVTFPHFANVITYSLIARALVSKLNPSKTWITLAPCSLNNNQTLSKLVINEKVVKSEYYNAIPDLKPPHFVTGIVASVISQLNLSPESRLLALVLNSEGQSGFEKSDNDAIVDAAVVVADVLHFDERVKEEYLKKVSLSVRKFNGFSNSGMYI